MTKRNWFLGVAALAALLAAGAATQAHRASARTSARPDVTTTTADDEVAAIAEWVDVAGSYALHARVDFENNEESSRLELAGTMSRWPLAESRYLLRISISGAESRVCTHHDLAHPFAVETDARGVAQRLRFTRAPSSLCLNVIRHLVASTQLARPSTPASTWESAELDAAGEFRALYRAYGRGISKRKLRYERVWNGTALVPPTADGQQILHAATRVHLTAEGAIDKLTVSELAGLSLGGAQSGVRVRTSIEITRRGQAPGATPAVEGQTLSLPMHAEPHEGGPIAPGDVRPISELLALPDSDDLQGQVLATLRADSSALAEIARQARAGKLTRSVMNALASEGSPAAQRVLSELVEDRRRRAGEREEAADALAWTARPTDSSLTALDEARTDPEPSVRETATLAYGTAIHQQQKHDAGGAARRSEQLARQLATASTPEQVLNLLRTLGNAGDAAQAEAILALTQSPDAGLRAAAYRALRLILTPQVDAALVRGMTSDPEPEVRHAALFAAGMRPVEHTFTGLNHVCRGEAVTGLRSDAMSVLAAALEEGASGDVVELLVWISEHDADAELRSRAAALLNG